MGNICTNLNNIILISELHNKFNEIQLNLENEDKIHQELINIMYNMMFDESQYTIYNIYNELKQLHKLQHILPNELKGIHNDLNTTNKAIKELEKTIQVSHDLIIKSGCILGNTNNIISFCKDLEQIKKEYKKSYDSINNSINSLENSRINIKNLFISYINIIYANQLNNDIINNIINDISSNNIKQTMINIKSLEIGII
jgi:DNA repair ATPase RecN